jgi:hypothetical protein
MLEHNPNCPSPFLVRLPGWGTGVLDRKVNMAETNDAFGYGKTLELAADVAFKMHERQKAGTRA